MIHHTSRDLALIVLLKVLDFFAAKASDCKPTNKATDAKNIEKTFSMI